MTRYIDTPWAEMACALCGNPAEFIVSEGLYRHKGDVRQIAAQTFCDRYGYPIPVVDAELRKRVETLERENRALREALEALICGYCNNRIGWNGEHTAARNADHGTLNWRTCPTCKNARKVLAEPTSASQQGDREK